MIGARGLTESRSEARVVSVPSGCCTEENLQLERKKKKSFSTEHNPMER